MTRHWNTPDKHQPQPQTRQRIKSGKITSTDSDPWTGAWLTKAPLAGFTTRLARQGQHRWRHYPQQWLTKPTKTREDGLCNIAVSTAQSPLNQSRRAESWAPFHANTIPSPRGRILVCTHSPLACAGIRAQDEPNKIVAQEQLYGHEKQKATHMAIESMHELSRGALIPTLQGHETCQPQPAATDTWHWKPTSMHPRLQPFWGGWTHARGRGLTHGPQTCARGGVEDQIEGPGEQAPCNEITAQATVIYQELVIFKDRVGSNTHL